MRRLTEPLTATFGIDFRNTRISTFQLLRQRGSLVYNTLQDLVDDVAQTGMITSPLPGGELVQHYDYKDYFAFWQDEWRVWPRLSFTFGLRYEAPGNPFAYVAALNQRILKAVGGNPRFDFGPTPGRDTNNSAPRLGFNYRVARLPGFLGRLTGDVGSVIRGGYAPTYDVEFVAMVRHPPIVSVRQIRFSGAENAEFARSAAQCSRDANNRRHEPARPHHCVF